MRKDRRANGTAYLSSKKKKRRGNPAVLHEYRNRNGQDFKDETTLEVDATLLTPAPVLENTATVVDHGPCLLGRRIVDVMLILDKVKKISCHQPFDCNFADMEVFKVVEKGLKFTIWMKCMMCGLCESITNDENHSEQLDLNTAAVSGAIAAGIGHKQLEVAFGAMNIPMFTDKTFAKIQEVVYRGWEDSADRLMQEAVEEEKAFAIERGDVDERDGVPLLTVIADGCWSKRSYKSGYSALSGVGAIIGYHTRKVLFIGSKNKYCVICARAENAGTDAKKHVCYKNWDQPSSSMEAAIITEGFMKSEEMYGVRYSTLIGDGDSNVYSSILAAHPYINNPVEKVECRNHLLRNFVKKMKTVAEVKGVPGYLRNKLRGNILRMRKGIVSAIRYRCSSDSSNKILELKKDILNCPNHVFGDHTQCEEYFCNKQNDEDGIELVRSMRDNHILWYEILKVINSLAEHSKSLIINIDSNPAEIYNNVVAKFVGGKRINLIQKQSYQGRCNAAVASFNSNGKPLYHLTKTLCGSSPGFHCKGVEAKAERKILKKRERGKNANHPKRKLFADANGEGYGYNSAKPDVCEDDFNERKKLHMEELESLKLQRECIEKDTVDQSLSDKWINIRKLLLTSSHFGRVCKKRATTSCSNIVKEILYTNVCTPSMMYGNKYETIARQKLSEICNVTIDQCGLHISNTYPFLGASPDGLIGDDGVVEIKCPSSCASLTVEEGLRNKKINPWRLSEANQWVINKNHQYYYQVQGQLAITDRKYCLFCVWTPNDLKYERIERDESFWEEKMLPHLVQFYFDCLLPELIDPRHTRSMKIRDPSYFVGIKGNA